MKQGGGLLARRPFGRKSAILGSAGFTIVETLIVLGVTAGLFVSASLLISGRQNSTQFMTAINNITQQLQQIINETASGFYPNNNNFKCTAVGVGVQPTIDWSQSNSQGTNQGCVFLGKVVEFIGSTDPGQILVFPIVGNQTAINVPGANPIALAQVSTANCPSPSVDQVTCSLLQNGITAYSMYYFDTSGTPTKTAGVGFLAGDASGSFATPLAGGYKSGSQQLSLYGIGAGTNVDGSPPSQKNDMITALNATNAVNYKPAARVEICFASGGTNQSGLVTIGGAGSLSGSLGVQLSIRTGTTC